MLKRSQHHYNALQLAHTRDLSYICSSNRTIYEKLTIHSFCRHICVVMMERFVSNFIQIGECICWYQKFYVQGLQKGLFSTAHRTQLCSYADKEKKNNKLKRFWLRESIYSFFLILFNEKSGHLLLSAVMCIKLLILIYYCAENQRGLQYYKKNKNK